MTLLIKRKNGKAIGFLTYERIGKPKHRLFEVIHIVVSSKYRHEGIGTELFNRLLKKHKWRKIFLTTHASNKGAHKFYEKLGMKMEAVLPNHYYKGEPELVYSIMNKSKF